ncbi:unnamed protein product [Rhizophagus irregularis]|nr:unnamed protein product [Rhizophagus irregularis]
MQYMFKYVPGDDKLWYRILIVGTYLIRAMDPKGGIETISNLFSNGFLNSTLNSTIRNDEFENFAENFTYEELMKNLQYQNYTVATSLTTLVMWIELLLLLRFFSGPANYINISLSIIRRVFYFFIFMFILIIAIAHSMDANGRFSSVSVLKPRFSAETELTAKPTDKTELQNRSQNYCKIE